MESFPTIDKITKTVELLSSTKIATTKVKPTNKISLILIVQENKWTIFTCKYKRNT